MAINKEDFVRFRCSVAFKDRLAAAAAAQEQSISDYCRTQLITAVNHYESQQAPPMVAEDAATYSAKAEATNILLSQILQIITPKPTVTTPASTPGHPPAGK